MATAEREPKRENVVLRMTEKEADRLWRLLDFHLTTALLGGTGLLGIHDALGELGLLDRPLPEADGQVLELSK